jgi:sortase B
VKRGKFEKRRTTAPLWYYLLLILLVGIFLVSVWYLADYFIGSRQQASAYDDLAALVDAVRPTEPIGPKPSEPGVTVAPGEDSDETVPEEPTAPAEPLTDENGILLEYSEVYAMNPDMAGWISIADTKINYPVMHTPDRKDYYLKRNFKGEYSSWGCIYAREECNLNTPSDNVTLYGHNMKDGSMFAGLHAYMKREFWENHRYIRFDTLTEHHTYEIFAVFTTTASMGEGFEYHEFIDADDEQEFDMFISKCLSMSLYGTSLVPEYGDKIICLSTCEYSQTNGRLVVAAVRID